MDARERLRKYLEERRDLGESEFVLDSMSVDDVLRAIGAISTGPGRAGPVDEPRDRPANGGWRGALTAPVQGSDPALVGKDADAGATRPATSGPSADILRLATLESIADVVESCKQCPL
ncbi:MAG: hypothetical protein M3R07_05705, partial [Gemmatimonadota bacterium]|nr:hypothetical protein [Gemmatimonadota bacterium]